MLSPIVSPVVDHPYLNHVVFTAEEERRGTDEGNTLREGLRRGEDGGWRRRVEKGLSV
jgi:hypothetical protein